MTRDSDFKNIVRARMAETGQTYTAARADLMGEGTSPVPHDTDQARPAHRDHASGAETTAFVRASAEQAKIIGRFFHDGRLTQVPMKRKVREAVLLQFFTLFEPGRDYPEAEVNEILGAVHDDFAFWRRELVDYGYLTRAAGIYRLAERAPERPEHMRQEIPDWEAIWLPTHLSGGVA